MSETDTMIAVGDPLPRLASVEPANGPTSVRLVWASGPRQGEATVVDLAPMIYRFKVFRPLRDDPALFRSVRLGEWGASIVWGDNDDLDIGADALDELACEQMTPADFNAFMKRHGFSYDVTAAVLGISRRLVAYYAKEREIPRTVALACKYIDIAHPKDEPADKSEMRVVWHDMMLPRGFTSTRAYRGDVGTLSASVGGFKTVLHGAPLAPLADPMIVRGMTGKAPASAVGEAKSSTKIKP
jgi:hypothetical protein